MTERAGVLSQIRAPVRFAQGDRGGRRVVAGPRSRSLCHSEEHSDEESRLRRCEGTSGTGRSQGEILRAAGRAALAGRGVKKRKGLRNGLGGGGDLRCAAASIRSLRNHFSMSVRSVMSKPRIGRLPGRPWPTGASKKEKGCGMAWAVEGMRCAAVSVRSLRNHFSMSVRPVPRRNANATLPCISKGRTAEHGRAMPAVRWG